MRLGVALVHGMDPVPLALLDRITAQANTEWRLRGDPRGAEVVRVAAGQEPVLLHGGTRVRPDALFRETPGLDALVLIGTAEPARITARDEEALARYVTGAAQNVQHLVAMGEGVHDLLRGHATVGRRVVMNHLPPVVRSSFDATLAAHTDPARDGSLWTCSDPLRFAILLLDLYEELGGSTLRESIEIRMPWLGILRRAFSPEAQERSNPLLGPDEYDAFDGGDDDHDGDDGMRVLDVT